jgi:hypothetical protein
MHRAVRYGITTTVDLTPAPPSAVRRTRTHQVTYRYIYPFARPLASRTTTWFCSCGLDVENQQVVWKYVAGIVLGLFKVRRRVGLPNGEQKRDKAKALCAAKPIRASIFRIDLDSLLLGLVIVIYVENAT